MFPLIQDVFAIFGIAVVCYFLYSFQEVPFLQYLWAGVYVIFYYALGVAYDEEVMAMVMALVWSLYYLLGASCLLIVVPLMVISHIWALVFGPYPKIKGAK